MANPYSKYTGARVQPLPAGFIEAYGRVGESYRKGIVGLAEGIQRYYQNKEERAIATGEAEALFAVVKKHGDLYPDLINDEMQKKLETMDDMSKPQLLKFVNSLKQKKSGYDNARKAEQEKALMQLQRDKLEAEKKKNLADAEAARLKAAEEARKRTDEQGNLLALKLAAGAIPEEELIDAYYLPDKNVSVPLDSPMAQPSMLRPFDAPAERLSEEYFPAVRSGDLPNERAAKALYGTRTVEGFKEVRDLYETEGEDLSPEAKRVRDFNTWMAKNPNATPAQVERMEYNYKLITQREIEAKKTEQQQAKATLTKTQNENDLHAVTKRGRELANKVTAKQLTPEYLAYEKKQRWLDEQLDETKLTMAKLDLPSDLERKLKDELLGLQVESQRLRNREMEEITLNPEDLKRKREADGLRIKQARTDLNAARFQLENDKNLADEKRNELLARIDSLRDNTRTPQERLVDLQSKQADLRQKAQTLVKTQKEIAKLGIDIKQLGVKQTLQNRVGTATEIAGMKGAKFVWQSATSGYMVRVDANGNPVVDGKMTADGLTVNERRGVSDSIRRTQQVRDALFQKMVQGQQLPSGAIITDYAKMEKATAISANAYQTQIVALKKLVGEPIGERELIDFVATKQADGKLRYFKTDGTPQYNPTPPTGSGGGKPNPPPKRGTPIPPGFGGN